MNIKEFRAAWAASLLAASTSLAQTTAAPALPSAPCPAGSRPVTIASTYTIDVKPFGIGGGVSVTETQTICRKILPSATPSPLPSNGKQSK